MPARSSALLTFRIALTFAPVLCRSAQAADAGMRSNPLAISRPGGAIVESCADPTVIRGAVPPDTSWYMYCTSDPLSSGDVYHLIPTFRSQDLVHWEYAGDVFSSRPSWIDPGSNLWAPEIQYFNGKYYLYYAATNVAAGVSGEPLCGDDSAIGVATSTSPTGPWNDHGSPVVAPRRAGSGCDFYATIDPEVITADNGKRYIYYGSFYGGIEVRELSPAGFFAPVSGATRVVIGDRGEGALIARHDGAYYLLISISDCCRGPLSGYAVVAGRSWAPTGPFVDREGVSLNAARAGGTPVLSFTGDRWVGPGHNTIITDFDGQDWTIYHAIDRDDPYFAGSVGFTKRPGMIDPLDWTDGWPMARGGWWVSSCSQPAPAAQPGQTTGHRSTRRDQDRPASLLPSHSDEFSGSSLGPQWSWVRQPPSSSYGVGGGVFRLDTRATDLYEDSDNASVLTEAAPAGDFLVEARVNLNLPSEGCCTNYVQSGLMIYGDDDNYIKLVHVSIWGTRQTEYAKEEFPVPAGYPRYGKTFIGPPDDWTYLRVVRRAYGRGELYTGYTSRDGVSWTRGGTWEHALGTSPRIGLVSMGGSGYTANFDYVRMYALAGDLCDDPAYADPCDTDADGAGDACDADDDGDLVTDAMDCAPISPAEGKPPEVSPLDVTGVAMTLVRWPGVATADVYDVSRGLVSALAAGDYGVCFADELAGTSISDAATPEAGESFFYLVRGVDAGCGGVGSYGTDSAGIERINGNLSACP